jgi:hypothetical protein
VSRVDMVVQAISEVDVDQPLAGHAFQHPARDSCRLWTVWELMLKQAALEFGRAAAQLAILEFSCRQARQSHPQVLVDPSGQLEKQAYDILGNLKRVCILADLQEMLPEIDRFGAQLNGDARIEDIGNSAGHLKHRLFDELNSEYYFQIDRRDVRFYGQREPFGQIVAQKFKAATDDIERAGNCLALREPTACIFHLMRAMEIAVRKLGAKVNVTITPQSTWRLITGAMDAKIKGMPDATDLQKRKKNAWEGARANLHQVGSVWRNNTMHPATAYTPSQALDVYGAVRVFMNGLCAL